MFAGRGAVSEEQKENCEPPSVEMKQPFLNNRGGQEEITRQLENTLRQTKTEHTNTAKVMEFNKDRVQKEVYNYKHIKKQRS